jgi:hypothetical protein
MPLRVKLGTLINFNNVDACNKYCNSFITDPRLPVTMDERRLIHSLLAQQRVIFTHLALYLLLLIDGPFCMTDYLILRERDEKFIVAVRNEFTSFSDYYETNDAEFVLDIPLNLTKRYLKNHY